MEGSATRARLPAARRKWARPSIAGGFRRWRGLSAAYRFMLRAGAKAPTKRYSALFRTVAARVPEIRLLPILVSLGLVAATTLGLMLLHSILPIDHVTLVFLVPV